MSDQPQAKFEGWAVVEVMGHQSFAGYVTTEAFGAAILFRIDVPALEARERVTKAPGYINDQYAPAGTTVQEGATPGYTKLFGAGSIYCITPCSEDFAKKAVERSQPRPLISLQLPTAGALPAPIEPDDEDDEDNLDGDDAETFGGPQ